MSFTCPECGKLTETLDTRGLRRRRVCTSGHRTTTYEITKEELEYLNALKTALAPQFQLFSKELHDTIKQPDSVPGV
jgi:hypothetical protein